jgi:hypothetical protein
VLPITATVTAGEEVDLLAADLDLHQPHADEPAPAPRRWVWLVAALPLVAAAWAFTRRRGAA